MPAAALDADKVGNEGSCAHHILPEAVSLASVVSRQDQHYQLLQQSNKCWGREVKIVVLSQFD